MEPNKNLKICFLASIWPERRSSGGGVRTFSLVQACLRAGHELFFLATSKPNEFSAELEKLGVKLHQIRANDSNFQELFRSINPDIAIFDRFMTEEQYAWQVREVTPNCLRVLDTIDLHFLRKERSGITDDTVYRELASLYRSDLSLIISAYEVDYLQKKFQFPPTLLGFVPFFYPRAKPGLSFSERKHFIFLGNYRHPPNFEAANHLAHHLWAKIRALVPYAELHLYGAYAPKEIAKLHAPEQGLFFLGQAPDQYETLAKYRINLAPIRFGAGLKGKIADGWSVGTPCISTSIGAESMGSKENWGGMVCDDEEEFAQASAQLYENETLWMKYSARAQNLLDELFSEEREEKKFIRLLEAGLVEMASNRSHNFIGAMLWHHSLQSTKYFAKWIEEKNKKPTLS